MRKIITQISKWDILLSISIFITLICFFNTKGTSDVIYYTTWITNAVEHGIIRGYAINADKVPPLSSLSHFLIYTLGGHSLDLTHVVTLTNYLFLIVAVLLIRIYTKSVKIAGLTFAACFLSVINGYIDILTAPFLILSFYFIKREKYIHVGISAFFMCMMKFQPLIIAPLLLFYFFSFDKGHKRITINVKPLLKTFTSIIILLIGVISIYGEPVISSLLRAFTETDTFYSPQALNISWILQYILEVTQRNYTGEIQLLRGTQPTIMYVMSNFFWIAYLAIVVILICQRSKNTQILISCSLLVYTAYYIMRTGVHENHFFIGMLLGSLTVS